MLRICVNVIFRHVCIYFPPPEMDVGGQVWHDAVPVGEDDMVPCTYMLHHIHVRIYLYVTHMRIRDMRICICMRIRDIREMRICICVRDMRICIYVICEHVHVRDMKNLDVWVNVIKRVWSAGVARGRSARTIWSHQCIYTYMIRVYVYVMWRHVYG